MVLAYYGTNKTQIDINKAGNPKHPDLYWHELVPAIMNVTNNQYIGYNMWLTNDTYINFIKHSIDNNNPLIVGFKLNPSSHTNWTADHVSVVNGYDENGLYILTTWDNNPQIYRTWEQLSIYDLYTENRRQGYSFMNIDSEFNEWPFNIRIISISKNNSN